MEQISGKWKEYGGSSGKREVRREEGQSGKREGRGQEEFRFSR
jgi:hypothetical protein